MGPTASGKTALAIEIATRLPAEIISVDSAQAYRGMNVGTAKPSAAERAAVPHHLIDIIDPTDAYSTARFREDALRLIAEIAGRGRLPLLVGGTMLYFKSLREGLSNLPQADAGVRAEIDARATRAGWPALHAELAKVDPVTAARLQPGDSQRIQRALEVHQITGLPLSQLQGQRQQATDIPYRPIGIALLPSERAALHRRIEARFEAMLRQGLVEELRALRQQFALTELLPSMRTVGYRQAWSHLEGRLSTSELRDRGIFATRQLAKRQLTWLRSTPDVQAFDCLASDVATRVHAYLQEQRERLQAPGLTP